MKCHKMQHAAFNQGLHCLLRYIQSSGTGVHNYLGNCTCNPLIHIMDSPIQIVTRAEVDGTPSQIPAFLPMNYLYLGAKATQNVAQYLMHNMTYAPVKFEFAMSNGKGEGEFT